MGLLPPLREEYFPTHVQKLYFLLLLLLQANILNFKKIGLKQFILGAITLRFTLYRSVKDIENFEE